MDNNLPDQQIEQPQVTNNQELPNVSASEGKKGLLYGIVFVIIILVFFLGILNYFNILPISGAFPNQLSWLPRMSSQKTTPTVPIQTIPTPATITISKKALEVFSKFISNNLTPSVSISSPAISLKEDDKEQNTFSANWEGKIGTMSATFALFPTTKDISYLYLSSIYNAQSYTSLSPQTAKDIALIFFTAIQKGEWACKPLYESTYCESFWQENATTKRGISINGPLLSSANQSILVVSLCEYHKEADLLYSRKSCTTEFADTGVQ